MSGGGSFTKSGTGTLTVTNSNTYSGGTTISGGTLSLNNGGFGGDLGSGDITQQRVTDFCTR